MTNYMIVYSNNNRTVSASAKLLAISDIWDQMVPLDSSVINTDTPGTAAQDNSKQFYMLP